MPLSKLNEATSAAHVLCICMHTTPHMQNYHVNRASLIKLLTNHEEIINCAVKACLFCFKRTYIGPISEASNVFKSLRPHPHYWELKKKSKKKLTAFSITNQQQHNAMT